MPVNNIFRVLATLSNKEDVLPADKFKAMVEKVTETYRQSGVKVVTLYRRATPDFINLSSLDVLGIAQI